jgi:hypothetical protein
MDKKWKIILMMVLIALACAVVALVIAVITVPPG